MRSRRGCATLSDSAVASARALGDEPTSITQLVRNSIVTRVMQALERLLAQCELSDSVLARIQDRLSLEADHPRLLIVARGERATWTLEMMQAPMRMAARIAYPLLRWGHDRVVDATVDGFRRHLAGDQRPG